MKGSVTKSVPLVLPAKFHEITHNGIYDTIGLLLMKQYVIDGKKAVHIKELINGCYPGSTSGDDSEQCLYLLNFNKT